MSVIIYRPDGERLTLQETLQYIADNNLIDAPIDIVHIYGDFNTTKNALVDAIESIDFNLSGLTDALGMIVADAIPLIEKIQDVKRLLAAYQKYNLPTPSVSVTQRISLRVAQWAQKHLADLDEFRGFYLFQDKP